MSEGRVLVGVYLPQGLDKAAERLAVELDTSKSRLAELGLRILLAILEAGRVPDDLGYLLEKHDPEAIRQLQILMETRG